MRFLKNMLTFIISFHGIQSTIGTFKTTISHIKTLSPSCIQISILFLTIYRHRYVFYRKRTFSFYPFFYITKIRIKEKRSEKLQNSCRILVEFKTINSPQIRALLHADVCSTNTCNVSPDWGKIKETAISKMYWIVGVMSNLQHDSHHFSSIIGNSL